MLRINEAIARVERKGKKVFKKDLAALLWSDSSVNAQQVNMTKLVNGTSKKVSIEWVEILCRELNCTADYLFGLSND